MFEYSLTARLQRYTMGTPPGRVMSYTVVFLDAELERALFADPATSRFVRGGRVRFTGELEDLPVSLAWQPAKGRGRYAMISPALQKQLKLRIGDEVTLRFDLDDPDRVVVPEDIERHLAGRARDRVRWRALSAGEQRALIAFVASARTDATRERRIADLFGPLDALRTRAERIRARRPRRATSRRSRTVRTGR